MSASVTAHVNGLHLRMFLNKMTNICYRKIISEGMLIILDFIHNSIILTGNDYFGKVLVTCYDIKISNEKKFSMVRWVNDF